MRIKEQETRLNLNEHDDDDDDDDDDKPIHFVGDMFWPTFVIIREFVQLNNGITNLADILYTCTDRLRIQEFLMFQCQGRELV